ncbi:MAG: hypothetical protein JNM08_05525 [Rubrivivax sp.]|nr:hypothetical protein [Rubrivivax sp.]
MTLPSNVTSGPRIQGPAPNQGAQSTQPTGRLAEFKLAVGKFFAKLLPSHGGGQPASGPSLHARSLGVGTPALPLALRDGSSLPLQSMPDSIGQPNYHEQPVNQYANIPTELLKDTVSEYANIPTEVFKNTVSEYANAPAELVQKPVNEYANIPTDLLKNTVSEYANTPAELLKPAKD